jgi:hypothetical protein
VPTAAKAPWMVASDPNAGIVEAAASVAKLRSVTEGALGAIAISQRNRQGYQSQLQNPRTDHDTNSEGLLNRFQVYH